MAGPLGMVSTLPWNQALVELRERVTGPEPGTLSLMGAGRE